MAKTEPKKEVKREETPFTHRHVVANYYRVPRFVSVCPKCNN